MLSQGLFLCFRVSYLPSLLLYEINMSLVLIPYALLINFLLTFVSLCEER